MRAQDFMADLVAQLQAERAAEPDLSEYADLIDTSWHWVGPAWTLPTESEGAMGGAGRVIGYASEFTVSPAMIKNGLDRHGRCLLAEVLRSEDVQMRLFGAVCARPGPWPEGIVPHEPGSVGYVEACHAERERAAKVADPDRRNEALRNVRLKYGEAAYFSGVSGQFSTSDYGGANNREQRPPDAAR